MFFNILYHSETQRDIQHRAAGELEDAGLENLQLRYFNIIYIILMHT